MVQHSVSYQGGADRTVRMVPSSLRHSQELDAKIQKCRRFVEQAQRRQQIGKSGGEIGDGLTLTRDEDVQARDDCVGSRHDGVRNSLQIAHSNEFLLVPPSNHEDESVAVQDRLNELLRDPTADLVIANPRTLMSGDGKAAKEDYKKQVERFSPEYYSNATRSDRRQHQDNIEYEGDDDSLTYGSNTSSHGNDSATFFDFLDELNPGGWITRPASNEGVSCLCCIPGERDYPPAWS